MASVRSRSCRIRGSIDAPPSASRVDRGAEGLVGAVLAPCLSERLEFDVGGSRSSFSKCSRMTCSSSRSSDKDRERSTASSASSSSQRTGMTSAAPTATSAFSGFISAVPCSQRSTIGLATSLAISSSMTASSMSAASNSMRWAVPAARIATPTIAAARWTASASLLVTPGRVVTSTPRMVGTSHDPSWSNGSTSTSSSRDRSWASRSPSMKTTSATRISPNGGRPRCCALAVMAWILGSSSIDRMVSRCPVATGATLRTAGREVAAIVRNVQDRPRRVSVCKTVRDQSEIDELLSAARRAPLQGRGTPE